MDKDFIGGLFALDGKTAFVTGASSGLGERFSKVLAKAGARVVLGARRADRLQRVCTEIASDGGTAFLVELDVADEASIAEAAKRAVKRFGKIDVLVNNAGLGGLSPVLEASPEVWDRQMSVNLRGTWLMTQAIAKHMVAEKIHGSIINVSSINGASVPYLGASAYGAAKAGVIHLAPQLVGELSAFGIRVNTIVPGLFETPATGESIKKKRKAYEAEIPLGFIGNVSDLDALILYLSSNKASRFVTGASFTVDGGVSAHCRRI